MLQQDFKPWRICVVASHPIQYQAPWFRELAQHVELKVWFAHQPNRKQQGAGFGKGFEWDVDLLSGYESEFLKNVSKCPSAGNFGGCDTPEIGERIREGGYDAVIVNGWYQKSYLQALWACRRLGVPVLVRGDSQLCTPRSRLKLWLKEPLYRWLLGRFDGFLTVGRRNREYLGHYGVPEERIFAAPHFVDNRWFRGTCEGLSNEIAQNRRDWSGDTDGLVVGFVGKFQGIKRAKDLLQAAAKLQDCSVTIVLVGAGEEEETLRQEARTSGVDAHFPGFKNQSELPACYGAMDVLVLPSESETWGLVVNEAMACGVPAIVSEACGCAPDLIEEGETGFTFPTGDVAALADHLRSVWQRKQEGYDWTGALERKMADYSVESCVAGTLEAVRQVSARR